MHSFPSISFSNSPRLLINDSYLEWRKGWTNKITFFESEELSKTFVLVHRIIIGCYAFSVNGCLLGFQLSTRRLVIVLHWMGKINTSAEHLATAWANFSMGLVRLFICFSISQESVPRLKFGIYRVMTESI